MGSFGQTGVVEGLVLFEAVVSELEFLRKELGSRLFLCGLSYRWRRTPFWLFFRLNLNFGCTLSLLPCLLLIPPLRRVRLLCCRFDHLVVGCLLEELLFLHGHEFIHITAV